MTGPFLAPLVAPLVALAQVLMIDLVLAGDNAVVVGLAVAGLEGRQKRTAILIGVTLAAALRIGLALVALDLLAVIGLTLAGGLLLLWVCWHMYRELRGHASAQPDAAPARKTLRQAVTQIVLADLSMSLDNVLAVAGAAHDHPWVLVAGLAMSVVLMAAAANVLARLLTRHRWIAWIGLLIVVYVALKMILDGSADIAHRLGCDGLHPLPHLGPPLHGVCHWLAKRP